MRNLHVEYPTERGYVHAVHDVSLAIGPGEYFGLVGESGCGKSTIAKAILRLLPEGTRVSGQVTFEGRDVLAMKQHELQAVRWAGISLITQSSMNSLDPVYRVGDQLVEAMQAHRDVSRSAAWSGPPNCWTWWASAARASMRTHTSSAAARSSDW